MGADHTMSGKPIRILLVDDYQDALDTWSMFLRYAGYEVLTAADGNEAVACAISAVPDVIVMDLELPGRTGVEAAAELRRNDLTARIPLIAVTGFSNPRIVTAAYAAGFGAVLVKPCNPELLVAEINQAIESHGAGNPSGHQASLSR